MARFRGIVEGSRQQVTRCGTPRSGLMTIAQSWSGDIRVQMYDMKGEDWVRVYSTMHASVYAIRTLYDGPLSGVTTARKYPTP